jgi:hypothetical protein
MAYASITTITCANKADAVCHFRDFVCKRNGTYDYSTTGIGWTLIDASYAASEDAPATNDWFVIYSPGENGKEDMFIKCTLVSNYLNIVGYQSWNAATHSGAANFGTGNCWNLLDSLTSFPLNIYGSLNHIWGLFYVSATPTWQALGFGKADNIVPDIDETIATSSSAISAGTDVVITLDTIPTGWIVGRDLVIRTTHNDDTSTVKKEVTKIKNIDGNTITVDLTKSYTANSKISSIPCYYVQSAATIFSTGYVHLSAANGAAVTILAFAGPLTGSVTPSSYEGKYIINRPVFLTTTGGLPGGIFPDVVVIAAFVAPMVDGDTITLTDGSIYKMHKVNSTKYCGFKVS